MQICKNDKMTQAKKCAEKLHHFEGKIRYHNTREVATHKIRNTVTHDEDCGWQGSRDIVQKKGPFPPPHATGLPVSGPIGLHSSLPFQD